MSDPVSRLNAALKGRYTIERELGEGGMATVYLARDRNLGRGIALKLSAAALITVLHYGLLQTLCAQNAVLPSLDPTLDIDQYTQRVWSTEVASPTRGRGRAASPAHPRIPSSRPCMGGR